MNLHIILNEKFTEKFIWLIDSMYLPESNIIYVYGDGNFVKSASANIKLVKNLNSEVALSLMKNSDKLFIHGFYSSAVLHFLFRNLTRIKKSQLVLIIWGADLYNSHFEYLKNPWSFKSIRHEIGKSIIIRHAKWFMTFAYADYNYARKWYGANGQQFDCLYPTNFNIEFLDEISLENKSNCKCKRILIGQSASETNKHIEILNTLKKYKNESFEIICPLSYGDKVYGKSIAEYGEKVFGDRFIPIFDYLTPADYARLLNSVHVAVFNFNRQQGTGNIEILGYLGKKIYIRSDTTLWEHYVCRDKCRFNDTLTIGDSTFEDFVYSNPDDTKINKAYFKKIWDIDYIKSLWDKVMNA